jgi:hypothetical protein
VTKTEYREARRLVRDNGRYALRWLTGETLRVMDILLNGQAKDWLAERADIVAYCRRTGHYCTPRHTGRLK